MEVGELEPSRIDELPSSSGGNGRYFLISMPLPWLN
jgi:hypothetical protein